LWLGCRVVTIGTDSDLCCIVKMVLRLFWPLVCFSVFSLVVLQVDCVAAFFVLVLQVYL